MYVNIIYIRKQHLEYNVVKYRDEPRSRNTAV